MLSMVEKVSEAECVTLFTDMWKLIINTWKSDDKIKESSHLKCWDINNLYRLVKSRNLPVYGLAWVEETSQFNEEFIKIYDKDSNIGKFLKTDDLYSEKLHVLHNDLFFLSERKKFEKIEEL